MGKRVNRPGDLLLFEGKLARVVSIAEGRSIELEFIDEPACSGLVHCAGCRPRTLHVLEHSRLFQQRARPAPTLEDDTAL